MSRAIPKNRTRRVLFLAGLGLTLSALGFAAYWRLKPIDPIARRSLIIKAGSAWAALTTPAPESITESGPLPVFTPLIPTPRARFRPTTRRGYWNADVVGDFTLPPTKALIFAGAGRNLHVRQDWSKLLRRGFSAIDRLCMVEDELQADNRNRPANWRSRLAFSQRSRIIYRNYFTDPVFDIQWARHSELAPQTYYSRPRTDPAFLHTVEGAMSSLTGGCVAFNDCPPAGMISTYGYVFLDLENDATPDDNRQEHANLYVAMAAALKKAVSPGTQIGSYTPIPHNSYGYSRASDYRANLDWLWTMPARHTATSRQRGMTNAIVGKRFGDLMDVQMPGTYFVYPDFDYTIAHTDDGARHWLASLLGEQEIAYRISSKKVVAWQWLFNTQSPEFINSETARHPAPPAIAEGVAIFYWFTGAYGALFWDDHLDLTPDQPRPTDPALVGLGNDRVYACNEHYVHGLWRLFKHHGDLFDGHERYLNEQTDCSYDDGKTWYKLNANQLKTQNRPFVRAIVNGNQILVAATMPYAKPGQISRVLLRCRENGHNFLTAITLNSDEIYLGRATLR